MEDLSEQLAKAEMCEDQRTGLMGKGWEKLCNVKCARHGMKTQLSGFGHEGGQGNPRINGGVFADAACKDV